MVMTVPHIRPHVARAVPTLAIVQWIRKVVQAPWSTERSLSSTSLKTAASGCGDKVPLDAE